jgi:hypothetical protein
MQLFSPLDQSDVIRTAAEMCLQNVAIKNLSVRCELGVLILRGQVTSYHQKQLA